MLQRCAVKGLSLYLAMAVFLLALPAQGWAMFLSSPAETRSVDLSNVQTALERTMLRQRLLDLGLSSEEAMQKVRGLSDDQLHQLAANMDSLQAGGDGIGAVIFLLLVAVVVIVVLQATDHQVVIRK